MKTVLIVLLAFTDFGDLASVWAEDEKDLALYWPEERRVPDVPDVQVDVKPKNPRDAVVRILVDQGDDNVEFGTGVCVAEDGTILTSWHIVDSGGDITVEWPNGEQSPAEFIKRDNTRQNFDSIATLRSARGPPAWIPVSKEPYREGDQVRTIGYQFVRRERSGKIERIDGYPDVWTSFSITKGMSGGPLINAAGAVVAIASGRGRDRTWNKSGPGEWGPIRGRFMGVAPKKEIKATSKQVLLFSMQNCPACEVIKGRFGYLRRGGWEIGDDGHIRVVTWEDNNDECEKWRVSQFPTAILVDGGVERGRVVNPSADQIVGLYNAG